MSYSTHEELARLGIGKKIRSLREQKHLSVKEIADKIKLTPVLMSQIESEVVPPTVATLLNISKVLGVGIDYFFVQENSVEKIELTRENERLRVAKSRASDAGRLTYNYQALSFRLKGKKMEPFLVEFDTETEENLVPLSHEGEEFCFCLEGQIEFQSEEQNIMLYPGDSLYYFSDIPHVLKGVGPGTPKAIFVLLPGEGAGG